MSCQSQTERPALSSDYESLRNSSLPLLMVDPGDESIVLATGAARDLLAPDADGLVGLRLGQFVRVGDSELPALIRQGHITGFQLTRTLTADPTRTLNLWYRTTDESDRKAPVLVLLSERDEARLWATAGTDHAAPIVIGSADPQLLIDRISEEMEHLLGFPPEETLGRSLLSLISSDDLASVLFGLGAVVTGQDGIGLTIKLIRADHSRLRCQLMLTPLAPSPSCAFAVLPALPVTPGRPTVPELRALLRRFGQGLVAAGTAKDLAGYRSGDRPLLPELTNREMQIVSRLLAGDRVPAISQQLYLAQSTVRNHLSAVFTKLGVRSQQELIVLLRQSQSRPAQSRPAQSRPAPASTEPARVNDPVEDGAGH